MKKYITLIILIFFFLSVLNANAQKEAYNWYFGTGSITFDTPDGSPEDLNSNLSSTAACDSAGKIIFYADGYNVRNKNGELMPHGKIDYMPEIYKYGHRVLRRIVIPDPLNRNLYYVMYVIFWKDYWRNPDAKRYYLELWYYIVNMSLEDGLGDVVTIGEENRFLLCEDIAIKLTAVKHKNNRDIWIISHELESRNFISYLFRYGNVAQKVKTNIGSYLSYHEYDNHALQYSGIGGITVSLDGRKLASVCTKSGAIEIFDFDNETGKLSNPIILNTNLLGGYPIWCEFSPDGRLLYSSINNSRYSLYQFNLLAGNANDIMDNAIEIATHAKTEDDKILDMQIGPDGKIYSTIKYHYHRNDYYDFLAVINNPNQLGIECNYIYNGVRYSGNCINHLLPNFIQSYFRLEAEINADTLLCEGDTIRLHAKATLPNQPKQMLWSGPAGEIAAEADAVIPGVTIDDSGNYTFMVTGSGQTFTDSVNITVLHAPDADISSEKGFVLCPGANLELRAEPLGPEYKYFWSTGETTESVTVRRAGTYSLTVESEAGCSSTDTVEVTATDISIGFTGDTDESFGEILIGEQQRKVITMRNYGRDSIEVTRAILQDGGPAFSLETEPPLPSFLTIAERLTLTLSYMPDEAGSHSDTLTIETGGPCGDTYAFPLQGSCISAVEDETHVATTIRIIPNPSEGEATVHLETAEKGDAVIAVYDASGVKVLSAEAKKDNYVLDWQFETKGLRSGIYFCRITVYGKVIGETKFIVSK